MSSAANPLGGSAIPAIRERSDRRRRRIQQAFRPSWAHLFGVTLHRTFADLRSNQLRVQGDLGPEHPGNRAILLGILRQPSERVLIQIRYARAECQAERLIRKPSLSCSRVTAASVL